MKQEFKKLCQELLGSECSEYLKSLKKRLPKYLRANQLRVKTEELRKRLESKNWVLEKVPWTSYGFRIVKSPESPGQTLEHELGLYYVQDASSMVPPIVLNPKKGESVLDLCASPGSKTTQMAQIMDNKGTIVANDYRVSKVKHLRRNLYRCGVTNTVVTLGKGEEKGFENLFDKVLVDAPCTGLGAAHKKPGIIRSWSASSVARLCEQQKNLAEAGFKALKKGGVMVYSTCTISVRENEEVVDHLTRLGAKVREVRVKGLAARHGVVRGYDPSVKKCARVYSIDNDSQSFFVAKVVKQ